MSFESSSSSSACSSSPLDHGVAQSAFSHAAQAVNFQQDVQFVVDDDLDQCHQLQSDNSFVSDDISVFDDDLPPDSQCPSNDDDDFSHTSKEQAMIQETIVLGGCDGVTCADVQLPSQSLLDDLSMCHQFMLDDSAFHCSDAWGMHVSHWHAKARQQAVQ